MVTFDESAQTKLHYGIDFTWQHALYSEIGTLQDNEKITYVDPDILDEDGNKKYEDISAYTDEAQISSDWALKQFMHS